MHGKESPMAKRTQRTPMKAYGVHVAATPNKVTSTVEPVATPTVETAVTPAISTPVAEATPVG